MAEKSTEPKHPAKFSPVILDTIREVLDERDFRGVILDPFAGTGRIHELDDPPRRVTVGIEIEPEWAMMHPRTHVGDALALPYEDGIFSAIITSPVYGNRMSDHHDAKDGSTRITYKHKLGRDLHPNNAGQMHFAKGRRGDAYRTFHNKAWAESLRVLKPGGLFVLNVSDFVAGGRKVTVSSWHWKLLKLMHVNWRRTIRVETPRMRMGANSQGAMRVDYEKVYVGVYEPVGYVPVVNEE